MSATRGNDATDEVMCWVCDWGWLVLPILIVGGLLYAFWGQLLPLVGLTPVTPTPTLGTGDVQATITWRNTNDIDLWVVEPSGAIIFFQKPLSASGGVLDVDANADCTRLTTAPIENIFWATQTAPQGEFKVQAQYFKQCEATTATSYHVRLKVDGKTSEYDRVIQKPGDLQTVTIFTR